MSKYVLCRMNYKQGGAAMNMMQLVIFRLNEQEYAIDIFKVNEIVPYRTPTKIPNSPDYIEGVLNLRDNVIPVINLKKRFNLENEDTNEDARIIVTNLEGKMAGFVVDEASNVVTVESEKIEPVTEVVSNIGRKYINGIGKKDDGSMYILLNFDELNKEG
jgi:purine-binding chemotaxis protein CheW